MTLRTRFSLRKLKVLKVKDMNRKKAILALKSDYLGAREAFGATFFVL